MSQILFLLEHFPSGQVYALGACVQNIEELALFRVAQAGGVDAILRPGIQCNLQRPKMGSESLGFDGRVDMYYILCRYSRIITLCADL